MAKSKWDEVQSKLILVEGWARDGLNELQIAQNLGISKATLENYKRDHLDFLDALKRGKEVVDRHVENALLKRALGYKYDEVTQELMTARNEYDELIKDDNGAVIKELKVTKIVTKEVQPDVTAQIFWLKNRKPKEWRDKQEIEHSGETTVNNKIDFSHLTTDQIRELLKNDKR